MNVRGRNTREKNFCRHEINLEKNSIDNLKEMFSHGKSYVFSEHRRIYIYKCIAHPRFFIFQAFMVRRVTEVVT